MLFTDSKVGSRYGRKTGSRSALKAAAASRSEGLASVDNRRGTKKQMRAQPSEEDANTYGDNETAVLHLFLRRMTESSAKPWNIWIPSHLKRHDRSI
jgi:hypothetical protein